MTQASYQTQCGRVKPVNHLPATLSPIGDAAPAPAKLYPNGRPLTERAGAATILAENAYSFEFPAAGGEDVYGCYKVEVGEDGLSIFTQEYALHAVGGVVTECNCQDFKFRSRVCKHMVELAVVLGTGLRTRRGQFVAAALTTVISGPKTVADALRAMREDYHAAAARAVILTAAAVEEAEREAVPVRTRPVVSSFDPSDIFADWK